tara:strand:+ start:728 stop:1003 length:276 start_codon:yes stop_codon:yes gene_type:complete
VAAVQRKTDANTGGGTISSTVQSTVFANSKLVSVNGSTVTTHGTSPNVHAGVITANGSSTVFAGGIAINRTDDADSCTHTRTGGSDDVFVG